MNVAAIIIVGKQSRLVQHRGVIASRCHQREVQLVSNLPGPHVGAQLPLDDVAREVVEHGRQAHLAPNDDLEHL